MATRSGDLPRLWLADRVQIPVGPLFFVIDGRTRGRPLTTTSVRQQLRVHRRTSARTIADRAIDGSKVKDGSLTPADLAGKVAGALTADGLAQIQRATIAGTNGAAPSGGFSLATATATCPAGTFVVGGGASLGDQTSQIVNDGYPSNSTSSTAHVVNVSPATPAFNVYAICVVAAAGG